MCLLEVMWYFSLRYDLIVVVVYAVVSCLEVYQNDSLVGWVHWQWILFSVGAISFVIA